MLPFPSPAFCAAAFKLCNCSLLVAELGPAIFDPSDSVTDGGREKVVDVEVDNEGGAAIPVVGLAGVELVPLMTVALEMEAV